MLAIAWQYLSGQASAMECSSIDPEWPPHPDRVFQALVAAWGERGCNEEERQVLEWLESQPAPHLALSSKEMSSCPTQNVYVPVNDRRSKNRTPDFHDRKARSFALMSVGDTVCALVWPDSNIPSEYIASLEAVCCNVTHIGHSRSMVRMWRTEEPPQMCWQPAERAARRDISLRVPYSGRLLKLINAYADGGRSWKRPPLAPYQGYNEKNKEVTLSARGDFDHRLIILRRTGGDGSPGLLQAPAFVTAIRATLLSHAGEQSKPLISGHQPDGTAMQAAHINWIPLAFVGSDYADGHLMGMAIALPDGIAADDEQAFFDTLADSMSANGKMELRAGSAGCMVLEEADAPGQPYALRQQTWTRPSAWWGTVTPIVLDRLPPRRHKNHDVWAAEQVARSCERQGLPVPVEVQILSISPFTGSPTCRRFPPLRRRSDGARQWHVHARICFEENVGGPLILGAGRYRGYGLCKPMQVEI